jgi:hypothetical protein
MKLAIVFVLLASVSITLEEVNNLLTTVNLQYLVLSVRSENLRTRLNNQKTDLDKLVMLIQAQKSLDQQNIMLQVVANIRQKHQEIENVISTGDEYSVNVSCYIQAAIVLRDRGDLVSALDTLAEVRVNALLAEERYQEADRLLFISRVYISELKIKLDQVEE